jgi:hypothetical protein
MLWSYALGRRAIILVTLAVLGAATLPASASVSDWVPVDHAIRPLVTGADGDGAPGTWLNYHKPVTPPVRHTALDASPSQVVDIPPAPGSLALALSALASLGLFQAGRALTRVELIGFVPEWYHTGGPVQVGYATPLDLDFGALAENPLAVPELDADAVHRCTHFPDDLVPQRRWLAPWLARGPPLRSC